MGRLRRLLGGFDALVRQNRLERELQEELRAYVEISAEEKMCAGMRREDALRAARIETGSLDAVRDSVRDVGWEAGVETVCRDVRYALRLLRRSPGFTAAAVLTLALGLGANTAVFSVLDAVLLRPLPYEDPSGLVAFSPGSYDTYHRWTDDLRSIDSSGAYTYSIANVIGGDQPLRVWTLAVTSSLLPTLGVSPLLGNGLTAQDDLPEAAPRVLLRYGFWKMHFGGNPALVGRTIDLDGRPHEVIGILPAAFEFPPPARFDDGSMPRIPDVWTGVGQLSDLRERGGFYAIGRLAPEWGADAAAAELLTVASEPAPGARASSRVVVQRVEEAVEAPLRPAMLAFTAGVGLILLIACSNLGSLLLVRLSSRERELAVRISLGASPARIAGQILTEGAVLALGGAVTGIGMAWLGLRAMLALAPPELARAHAATLNLRVLSTSVALAAVTGLLISLLPAWRALRREPRDDLASMRGAPTGSKSAGRLHASLVSCEVALAVVLLIAGGLLLRSFAALSNVNPGFRADGLVTADVLLPPNRYESRASVLQFFDRVEEHLANLQGVASVSAIDRLPYGPSWSRVAFRIAGRSALTGPEEPRGFNTAVRPGYFQTLGIPILEGREFLPSDGVDSRLVVVIGHALAEKYWPGEGPLGERIRVFGDEREIIGVAGDVRHLGPLGPVDPMIYLPQAQDAATRRMMTIVARTDRPPDAMLADVRNAIRAIDSQLPISNLRSFGALRSERTASERFNALLVASFALLGLLLAAVGIYGVMSFAVAQRTQEIGIRMALGADRVRVLTLVIRQSLLLTAAGVVLGILGAVLATRFLEGMLFGLTALDPLTFFTACALLGLVGMVSAYLPAHRATKVDPLVALRAE